MLEAAYVAFCLRVFAEPTCVLLAPRIKARYGALYEDLDGVSISSLSITCFHNLRLFVLIPLLVFTAGSPTFQSAIYVASAGLGLGWDLALAPYQGTLLTAQILLLGVAKVLASVGYVIMTVPTISSAASDSVCMYVIVVLLAAICGGLVLVLVQLIRGVCGEVREWYRRSREKVYMAGSTESLNSEVHHS